ncbi:fungal-specific transcription factor domain-containing protein [Epithele typhae]|uniref:fungal-specific transcription factor domain-containing protein n=1 Tax=Epithele typhae TaxID=378194 RepID=UPI0020083AE8|nr:fungal-specific transcription factor domain-containing protein [Epithele typhae]KAH9940788.1 fungal-specific transcription factor domain-containing protein [Epithele typhae]
MPAEPSKAAAAARRRNNLRRDAEDIKYDSSHAREIELKRSRGEISLKIRCDKTIPCQSCQRRGCAALCPNGSLATGQGTRFVLAATEHLHRRIAKMSARVHQLEDALAILQAKSSNEPHPLLSDGTSKNHNLDDDDGMDILDRPGSGDVVSAFGMLSVTDGGISRFFGPTGGTEYLLFSDVDDLSSLSNGSASPESARDSNTPPLPGDIIRFSNAFPFTPLGPAAQTYELIEGHLPPYQRACELAESYIMHASWLFRSVSRRQIFEELVPRFYKQAANDDTPMTEPSSPHDLGLFLLCLAIGALVDLKQQGYNSEGEHFCQLAQAAMALQPVLANPSLTTIQALHLHSIYVAMVGNEPGGADHHMEFSWALLTLAGQLAHTIGLHRDGARFGFSPEILERRRLTFWDLFVGDAWQSMMTGRPPVIQREYIDCKFPTPALSPDSEEGDDEQDAHFETWGFRFALQCVSEVTSKALAAETPSYETILELDRKVREFPIPPDATAMQEGLEIAPDEEAPPIQESMIRFVLAHSREVILLYLHRCFFAQAITDCPRNPLRSPYAHSFLTAYRSSTTILRVIREQFKLYPAMCARFWVIWTFAFSAAVVFATIVTRGPRSSMAEQALVQMDQAYELFQQASRYNRRAAKALPILLKLREKAHNAFGNAQNDSSGTYDGSLWSSQEDDELDIFAGRTSVIASKRPSPSPTQMPQPIPRHHTVSMHLSEPGDAPPIITPPTTLPIAPIAGSNGSIQLREAWPAQAQAQAAVVHSQSASQYPSIQGQSSQPPSHQPHTYRLSYSHSQPAPSSHSHQHPHQHPHPHVHHSLSLSPAEYQWVPQHQHAPAEPAQGYATAAPGPHVSSAYGTQYQPQQQQELLQRYADTTPYSHGQQQGAGAPQEYVPPSELVGLGLASRHGRLDERWTSFMHESGFL